MTERNAKIMALRAEGKSYGQIAKELNISRNAVAGVVHRNKAKDE